MITRFQSLNGKRDDNLVLVVYGLINAILFTLMLYCQMLFVSGILLFPGYVLFFLGVPIFIHTAKHLKSKLAIYLKLMLSIYLLTGIGLIFTFYGNLLLRRVALSLLPLSYVLLATINLVILLRSKDSTVRTFAIKFICVLAMSLTLVVPNFLSITLPYIYTPPALNSYNINAYKECVRFVKDLDQYKNLTLWRGLLFDGHDPIDIRKVFPHSHMHEIETLLQRLHRVKCLKLQRDNNMVIFFKNANYIFPPGPGIIYSLCGENPNEIDSEVLNAGKPFVRIANNWYMSKKLVLRGPRSDLQTSIPKSLFDYSLFTEGLNLVNGSDKKLGAENRG